MSTDSFRGGRSRILSVSVDSSGPWSAVDSSSSSSSSSSSPTAAISGGFALGGSRAPPPPKSPLHGARRAAPQAEESEPRGVDRMLLLRQMNVTSSAGYQSASAARETSSRPKQLPTATAQQAPAVHEVSAAQNHKERKAAEARRRQEVALMALEDYTGTPEGLARLARQEERANMQEEEVRMLRIVQAEKVQARAQQLQAQREEEARIREMYLAKLHAEREQKERAAKEKELARKQAMEEKMKALKAAADAKARDEFAARQRQLAAEALAMREQRIREMESAQLAVEDELAVAMRQDFLAELERKHQIAAEEAQWKRFQEAEAQRQLEATMKRRASQAAQYEQDKQRRMEIHRLQKERARLIAEKQNQKLAAPKDQPSGVAGDESVAPSSLPERAVAGSEDAPAPNESAASETGGESSSPDARCSNDDAKTQDGEGEDVRECPDSHTHESVEPQQEPHSGESFSSSSCAENSENDQELCESRAASDDATGVDAGTRTLDGCDQVPVQLEQSVLQADYEAQDAAESASESDRQPEEPCEGQESGDRGDRDTLNVVKDLEEVLHVKVGSPAMEATLRTGDLLANFGGITGFTPNCLLLIADKVKSSVGRGIKLVVLRPHESVVPSEGGDRGVDLFAYEELLLQPRKWKGKGLLGCQLNPFKWSDEVLVSTPTQDPQHAAQDADAVTSSLLVFYNIVSDSVADQIGIRSGDLLTRCGALESVDDLSAVLGYFQAARVQRALIELEIQRWFPEEQRYEQCAISIPVLIEDEPLGCSMTTFAAYYGTATSDAAAANSSALAACTECYYTSLATAVHAAALNGHVTCLEALLEASRQGHSDTDEQQSSVLDWRDEDGRSPLFYACYSQQVEPVRFLLAHLAREDAFDPQTGGDLYGDSPLHAATTSGSTEILALLLESKYFAVDVVNAAQLACAHVAPNAEVLQLLGERFGADLLVADSDGRMPLSHACLRGDLASVAYLCEKHPDFVDYADASGNTPLHLSAWLGLVDVLRELVKHVPAIALYLPNQDGLSPLEIARASGLEAAAQFLEDCMAASNEYES